MEGPVDLLFAQTFPAHQSLTRAQSPDSIMSQHDTDFSSNAQSSSSTPPTSAADDTASISSQPFKLEATSSVLDVTHEDASQVQDTPASSGRPKRARISVYETYNVNHINSLSIPGSRRAKQGLGASATPSPRRRTISGDTLVAPTNDNIDALAEFGLSSPNKQLVSEGIDALNLSWSPGMLPQSRSMASMLDNSRGKAKKHAAQPSRRISTRSAGVQPLDLAHTLSSLGKRARNKFEAVTKGRRELKRLADTNEFAKIETKPIFNTVWANGKFVPAGEVAPPPRKKARVEEPVKRGSEEKEETAEKEVVVEKKKEAFKGPKKWAVKGIFAGQNGEEYWNAKYARAKDTKPVRTPGDAPNGALPLPIYAGDRALMQCRDFKLPFDVCNPLPPGQPKPDEWRRMPKNRFVGDAQAAWKKSTLFDDFSSRCTCKPETGCDDWCQNRIMLYECDAGNCKFGAKDGICHNRAFAGLQERKTKGGKFQIGVEVIKTATRGYGVRSNRCFSAGQIITEYTGEIITESECDRRMNEDYINNACYYLMSFDQNTILDATEKGSIARFVNHSCDPNCRMVKWVVNGKPRMALFAADRDVMTGEELTYDYNFDPFSAKNMQECRCGSENCRGVLGPRPKDPKFLKPVTNLVATVKSAVVKGILKGKRKLQEYLTDEPAAGSAKEEEPRKKRKYTKRYSAKAVASTIKRSLSKTLGKSVKIPKAHVVKRAYRKRPGIIYGNPKLVSKHASRNSSLTIVATNDSTEDSVAKPIEEKAEKKVENKIKRKYEKKVVKLKSKTTLKRVKRTGEVLVPKTKGYVRKGGWGGARTKGVKGATPKNKEKARSVTPETSPQSNIVVLKAGSRLGEMTTKDSIRVLTAAESMDLSADFEDVE